MRRLHGGVRLREKATALIRQDGQRRWLGTAGLVLALTASHGAAKDPATSCSDICDTLTASACTVTSGHEVAAGSDIDCTSDRDITIDSGGLVGGHDAEFTIRGKSLTLANGGKIEADCDQGFTPIGFTVIVDEDVVFAASSQSKMTARCDEEGGQIVVEAGGDIDVDALGINVNGTAADAPGGYVRLDAGGTVTVLADVEAEATGGAAKGGRIFIRAQAIDVQAALSAKGYGNGTDGEMPGGDIVLDASGDVEITAGGGLNVETAKGQGGTISIHAGGLVDVQEPLRARGTSGAVGAGGGIEIIGDEVRLDADVIAIGGHHGGGVSVESRGGGIAVGASAAAEIDVTGNSGEGGGSILLAARGGSVTLGGSADLVATGSGGGAGGTVSLRGVDVTTASGASVTASGASPDGGGSIQVLSTGVLDLDGTMAANNGGRKTFVYRDGTPTVSGSITGYDLIQIDTLAGPCGDGVRNAGSEDCDRYDLGGETCTAQGQGTGTLGCAGSCTFDYSGCSGS